jgi:hypothetical protein
MHDADLGPFGSSQARDGLAAEQVESFLREMLADFKKDIEESVYNDALVNIREAVKMFLAGAKDDLRYSPIHAQSGVVEEWLKRLKDELDREHYGWVVAAKRWINVAFLGAGNADENEPIDFRIHTLIAKVFKELGDWSNVIEWKKAAGLAKAPR